MKKMEEDAKMIDTDSGNLTIVRDDATPILAKYCGA